MTPELRSREKCAKSSDAAHAQEKKMDRTNNSQAIVKTFPFLKLPAEIRNMVYRLLLVSRYVTTDERKWYYACKNLAQESNVTTLWIGDMNVGTIRCECWRTYKMGFQLSILRANRQINLEASTIFQIENFWTIVTVNKARFGREMKARGFPVATNANQFPHIKHPLLKVTVKFSGMEGEQQSDIFLLAAAHIKELTRALSTTRGVPTMEVTLEIQRLPLINAPDEIELLPPFMKLRQAKRVCIWSAALQKHVDILPHGITRAADIDFTYGELSLSLKGLERHIEAGEWRQAMSYAEEHSMFISDCRTIYGTRLLGSEYGLDVGTEPLYGGVAAKKIIVNTAICMAQINLHIDQYANSVQFADHAIYVSRLTRAGSIPAKDLAFMFVIRARARMGMDRMEEAHKDIREARKLVKPDSALVLVVMRAWEVKSGFK